MAIPKPKPPRAVFVKAIETLNKRGTQGHDEFEFPEYAGLPKSVSNKLTGDEVDYIQINWHLVKKTPAR